MKANKSQIDKKYVTKKAKQKKNPLEVPKSHSISCDDLRWEKIQKLADKAGMNTSKYIISKVLN